MSRSYKYPGFTCSYGTPCRAFYKRYSNKLTRLNKDLPNGGAYKKNGQSYNICDYKFMGHTRKWLTEWEWGIPKPLPCYKDLLASEFGRTARIK